MNYRDAKPDQRQPAEPEMCEQFTRLFVKGNDYLGEECLLKVLLKREEHSLDQIKMPDMIATSLITDHSSRRQLIFHILGIKTTATDKTPEDRNELVTG